MPGRDGTGRPENFLIVRVLYSGLISLFNKVHCSIFRADEPVQVCGLEFDAASLLLNRTEDWEAKAQSAGRYKSEPRPRIAEP